MERAILTAASNKFFPSLLNLLGSLKAVYPEHPPVFVYDLGLFPTFRWELEHIPGVRVVAMPHFISFWRKCYTWKSYIFAHPVARLNLYVDAGCQVLQPLEEMFTIIEADNYMAVEQGALVQSIVPQEYRQLFAVPGEFYSQRCITAGVFGYKNIPELNRPLQKLYAASRAGLCLGFSPGEQWKNKGKNKTAFVRNCEMFRHDTTLLNLVLFEYLGLFQRQDTNKFAGPYSPHDAPGQLLWNLRLNFDRLTYTQPFRQTFISRINRVYVRLFLLLKKVNYLVKYALS